MARMILAGIGAIVIGVGLTVQSFEKPEPGMPAPSLWRGPALIVAGLGTVIYFVCMMFRDMKEAEKRRETRETGQEKDSPAEV